MSSAASFRTEKDLLGVLEVPAQAYYGIQTLRAVNNFRLSGVPISHYPKLVVALAMVKQAAADANRELGHLSDAKHAAISEACARLIRGDFHEEFVVDMIQGGAGTSTNMNANEVIANIALEAMGHQKGEYQYLHPNNDVNMAQSTNDAYPTAIRVGLLLGHDFLLTALDKLIQSARAEQSPHGQLKAVSPTTEPRAEIAPACPKCSAAMVKREAKRGANAGQQFWGCTNYPGCRGTVPISR